MIELDDMELMQLSFCLSITKDKMMMGGEIRRHASLTQKVAEEMKRRKETQGAYTPEQVLENLEREIKELGGY